MKSSISACKILQVILDTVKTGLDGLGVEKCWSHKKKMHFLHSQWKGFTFLSFVMLLRREVMSEHRGMTICSPYCRKKPEDGHFPMLQLLFSQFPLQAFFRPCSLRRLLLCLHEFLQVSLPYESVIFSYLILQASSWHLTHLLDLQNNFCAALLAFANCCLCLIRQHLLEEISSLSCSPTVRAFYERDVFLCEYS